MPDLNRILSAKTPLTLSSVARGAQPVHHAGDGAGDVLVGRHQLAGSAALLGQLAQQALGRAAADPDHEQPVAGFARGPHRGLDIPDLAIGD